MGCLPPAYISTGISTTTGIYNATISTYIGIGIRITIVSTYIQLQLQV